MLKRWLLLVAVAGAVLAVDQAAKWLTVTRLAMGETWVPIPAISRFFVVTRSINTGAAFGMFPGASPFFLLLALITVVVFVISYPRLADQAHLTRLGIALVCGGALSNAIDRLRFGHVIDYFHVLLTANFSNISNFADHAITLGVILLLIDQWLLERNQPPEPAPEEAALSPDDGLPEGPGGPQTA